MSEGLETIRCATAEELFEAIRPRPRSQRGKLTHSAIFRGQGSAAHKLIPKALRDTGREQADMLVFKEWAMFCDFVRACDRSGVRIPGDGPSFRASLNQNTGSLNDAAKLPDRWPAELPAARGVPLTVVTVEDIVERSWQAGESLIQKYEVPRDHAGEVLELCEAFGVCAATMFPGADGAARAALERRARFDDEEARRG